MREKYESLSLATLKDLAKARGLKGVSTLRKPELIERMLQEDQLENEENNKKAEKKEPDKKAEEEEHKKAENESSQSHVAAENVQLDSGEKANGILEVLAGRIWIYPLRELSCREKMMFMYLRPRSADLI